MLGESDMQQAPLVPLSSLVPGECYDDGSNGWIVMDPANISYTPPAGHVVVVKLLDGQAHAVPGGTNVQKKALKWVPV